jgi:hypothetical protein
MSLLSYVSQAVYWIAKVYFMFFGILYILALLGRFGMDTFTNLTGIIAVAFLFSNIYWYFIRKG